MAAALVLVLASGCDRAARERPAPEEVAVAVRTMPVEEVQVPVELRVVGTTQAYARATPGTRLMGEVVEVNFARGDKVHQGQVLVRIENRDLEARRRQAESALEEARAVLANAEKNLGRMRNLQRRRALPQQKLDEAQTNYARARAGAGAAEEAIKEVDAQLRYSAVQSPLSGVVVQKFVQPGDLASPGQPLFAVEAQDPIKIILELSERDLRAVQVGAAVQVEIEALKKRLPARVEALVPAADPTSHTFQVRIAAPNPEGEIGSGMFARVRLRGRTRPALLVPAAAVVRRGQLQGLYVLAGGRAHLRWVRLGRKWEGRVEVLSGAGAGERVIVAPAALRDGQRVEVRGRG